MFHNKLKGEQGMFKESWESRNIPGEPERGRGPIAINRISWGAIFAGVAVAMVVQMVLSLLGLGLGMGAINPMAQDPFQGLATGALIWWIVTMLISLFTGGYVAGRLAGMPRNQEGILHGVLTWSVFTLLSFFLLTTAVGGIFNTVGNTVSKALSASGQQMDPAQAKDKITQEMEKRGLSQEEIKKQMENPSPEVKQKADDVSKAASKAGIFGAIGLLLGGIVAALGGLTGRPKHLLEDVSVPVKERVYTKQ